MTKAEWVESQAEHDRELDEMIARGWGAIPQPLIPKNWREEWGPEHGRDAARAAWKKCGRRVRRELSLPVPLSTTVVSVSSSEASP